MRLIDASVACDVIREIRPRHIIRHSKWVQEETLSIGQIYNALLVKVPQVDAEPVRHGHWVKPTTIGLYSYDIPHCSVCNGVPCGVDSNTNYCPNCGAKMDECSKGANT